MNVRKSERQKSSAIVPYYYFSLQFAPAEGGLARLCNCLFAISLGKRRRSLLSTFLFFVLCSFSLSLRTNGSWLTDWLTVVYFPYLYGAFDGIFFATVLSLLVYTHYVLTMVKCIDEFSTQINLHILVFSRPLLPSQLHTYVRRANHRPGKLTPKGQSRTGN